jgi:murein DD-endopeptidase MepM/ murein hydrolase activator NlpD
MRVVRFGVVAIAVASVTLLVTRSSATRSVDECGFDFPVGPPDATGYYDAQAFGENDHLGNDWNGVRGGDSDLGDPVHAVATGVVIEATDHGGGWGNVIRIAHGCGDRIESLYAHLDAVEVMPGQPVARGQRIGTIGTAHGQYLAHLHLELRAAHLPLGGGYSADRSGYLDPTAYIRSHRANGR